MYLNVSILIGKIIKEIVINKDDEEFLFILEDGTKYMLSHIQECCEQISIEDICGDLNDLLDTPILISEEIKYDENNLPNYHDESFTWTFYKFSTIKGSVTVRWYGYSNGYYSESVDFIKL